MPARIGENPTYSAAHYRLKAAKGRAALHKCVDCGDQAKDWSYDGQDPDELTGYTRVGGPDRAYSLDPARYVPRCRACHTRHDLGGPRKAVCANDHVIAEVGRDKWGSCNACRTEGRRRRRLLARVLPLLADPQGLGSEDLEVVA